jgi:hypothetical protein
MVALTILDLLPSCGVGKITMLLIVRLGAGVVIELARVVVVPEVLDS